MPVGLLSTDASRRLSDYLRSAGYTAHGIRDFAGAAAYSSYWQGDHLPLETAARGPGAAETLVRLFLLAQPVTLGDAARALSLDVAAPLLKRRREMIEAKVALRPYEAYGDTWWLCSDLVDYKGRDQVMPASGSSETLAALSVRWPVHRALDVGTGSGLHALHLSKHSDHVTALDVNERALRFARTTLELNSADAELLVGDRLEPVSEREFDLIVSNPPYVIGPIGHVTYRDSGHVGDGFCRGLVRSAAERLAPGGVAHILAQWLHVRGESWQDRVREWVAGLGCDALILEATATDVVTHVKQWVPRIGSGALTDRYDEWVRALSDQGAEGVGFGTITLRRTSATPMISVDSQYLDNPLGPEVADWLAGRDLLRLDEAGFRDLSLVLRPSVSLQESSHLRDNRWESEGKRLVSNSGLQWWLPIDDVSAAAVARLDGSCSLGAALETAAKDPQDSARVIERAQALLDRGFLHAASPAKTRIARTAFGLDYAVDVPPELVAALADLPGSPTAGAPTRVWSLDSPPSRPSTPDPTEPSPVDAWPQSHAAITSLRRDIAEWVAEHATDVVLLQVDTLLMDERLLVLAPGTTRENVGLRAALMRAGAQPWSSGWLAIDTNGSAHAWTGGPSAVSPSTLTIGLVCRVAFNLSRGWQVRQLAPAEAVLVLLGSSLGRVDATRAGQALDMIRLALRDAVTVDGFRGDADEAANQLAGLLRDRQGRR